MRTFAVTLCLFLGQLSVGFAGDLAPTENDQLWLHRNLGAAYFANGDHAEAEPPAPPFRPAPGTGGAGTAAEAVAPGEDVGEADAAPPVNGGEPDGA